MKGERVENRSWRGASIVLTAIALAIPLALCWYWIQQDMHPAYWDRRSYLTLARAVSEAFGVSLKEGFALLWRLTSEDYNGYYVVPLIPFLHGQKTLLDEYLRPLLLFVPVAYFATVMMARQVVEPAYRPRVSHVLALMMLAPMGWSVAIGGLPDLLPAAFMSAALLAFMSHLRRANWIAVAVGALCLGMAMALRRHFAYPALASLVALGVVGVTLAWRTTRRPARALLGGALAPLVAGLVVVAVVAVMVPGFLQKAVSQQHTTAYSSYINTVPETLFYLFNTGGLVLGVTAALGWGLLLRSPHVNRSLVAFVSIWLLTWAAVWVFKVRYINDHYFFGMWLAFLAVGLVGLVDAIARLKPLPRSASIAALACVMLGGLLFTLLPAKSGREHLDGGVASLALWPRPHAPADAGAFSQYASLLQCIEANENAAGRPLAVVMTASSQDVNRDLLLSTYEQIGGKGGLTILPVPEVDSRDASPLATLAQADVVVATSPFQHHLRPEEQRVVKSANDLFARPSQVRDSAFRRACGVTLPGAIDLMAYRRTRPLDGPLLGGLIKTSEGSGKPSPAWILEQDGFEWASITPFEGGHAVFGNAGVSTFPTIFVRTERVTRGAKLRLSSDVGLLNEACPGVHIVASLLPAAGGERVPLAGARVTREASALQLDIAPPADGFVELQIHTGSPDRASMGGCGVKFTLHESAL